MRYFRTARFRRAFRSLDRPRQGRVEAAMRQLEAMFDTGLLPHGLGVKRVQPGIWECRAGLSDRILLSRTGDVVQFLLVGNHDDIRRVLRSL